jgi:hypothetical protein
VAVDRKNKRNAAKEADRKILKLLRAFNEFPCVQASCVSTAGPRSKAGRIGEKSWNLSLSIERNETGWFVLEFLAWLINNDFEKAGMDIQFLPDSQPPYLNFPGRTLLFEVSGTCLPDQTADAIRRARKECFIAPEHLEDFILDSYGPECLESYTRQNQKNPKTGASRNLPSLEQLKAAAGERVSLPSGVIRFRRA